jgi:HEAT repeat protein
VSDDDELPAVVFDAIARLLGAPDWQSRHAALIAVTVVAEGFRERLVSNVSEVVGQLAPLFSDAHPRVRWAALNALGQLCMDLGPELQESAHAVTMSCLGPLLDDHSSRVSGARVIACCE